MTKDAAIAVLWGNKVQTSESVAEELRLNRLRQQREEEIDNEACREGRAIINALRIKKPRK